MKALSWAVRVAFANGRYAFLRVGGVTGGGPIQTFYVKEHAETQAAVLRQSLKAGDVASVIQRSHGRQVQP